MAKERETCQAWRSTEDRKSSKRTAYEGTIAQGGIVESKKNKPAGVERDEPAEQYSGGFEEIDGSGLPFYGERKYAQPDIKGKHLHLRQCGWTQLV